jgi:hypothetical protein
MAAFALALFLTGTHWCLVGGVASLFGAHISCMAPAAAGSCHASPTSHCGHGSPARPAPARNAAPPCCVALAPVVATSLVAVPDDALAPVLAASPAAEEVAPASAPWVGYRVTRDTGPPAPHTRAPLPPRAPPLA